MEQKSKRLLLKMLIKILIKTKDTITLEKLINKVKILPHQTMERADIIGKMTVVGINIIEMMNHTKKRKNNLANIIIKVMQESMGVDLGREEGEWMTTTITLRRLAGGVVIQEAIIINLDTIRDDYDDDDILMLINNMTTATI